MKEKILDKMRKSKPFEKADIIVYCVCIALVVILFLSLTLFKNNDKDNGFIITVSGKVAVTLDFEKGITIEESFNHLVVVEEEQSFCNVKIYTLDKTGYNLVQFNLENKTAKVIESNCSASKDCVHFPQINKSGTIYCAPHALKISPLTEDYKAPVAGEI